MSINAYMNDGPPKEWDTMKLLWPRIATVIFLLHPTCPSHNVTWTYLLLRLQVSDFWGQILKGYTESYYWNLWSLQRSFKPRLPWKCHDVRRPKLAHRERHRVRPWVCMKRDVQPSASSFPVSTLATIWLYSSIRDPSQNHPWKLLPNLWPTATMRNNKMTIGILSH